MNIYIYRNVFEFNIFNLWSKFISISALKVEKKKNLGKRKSRKRQVKKKRKREKRKSEQDFEEKAKKEIEEEKDEKIIL